jgi:hypothetical protein
MLRALKIGIFSVVILCSSNSCLTHVNESSIRTLIGEDINTLIQLDQLFDLETAGFTNHKPFKVVNNQFKEVDFDYSSEKTFQNIFTWYNSNLLGENNKDALAAMLNTVYFNGLRQPGRAICLSGDLKTQLPDTESKGEFPLLYPLTSFWNLDNECPFDVMPHNILLNLVFYYKGTDGKNYHFTFPFKIIDNQDKINMASSH